MSPSGPEIPFDRLPEGFARRIDSPPDPPVEPRPAATIVLMRPGEDGLETLLLRRNRDTGFVPGAWVFPGGRVDADDADEALLERLDGLDAAEAARRLELPDGDPPAVAYWIAAIREAFEETGILVGSGAGGGPRRDVGDDALVRLRDLLLEDETRFPEVLDRLGCRMDGADVGYIAHWITPEAEPRRYDTRFFAAAVGRDARVVLDSREMVDALWVGPAEALRRHREGELPMVFPTVKTLEALAEHGSPEEVLEAYRDRPVPTILPRLVRTPTGVGLEVDFEG